MKIHLYFRKPNSWRFNKRIELNKGILKRSKFRVNFLLFTMEIEEKDQKCLKEIGNHGKTKHLGGQNINM